MDLQRRAPSDREMRWDQRPMDDLTDLVVFLSVLPWEKMDGTWALEIEILYMMYED